jgi:hypothetical protein
MENKPDWTDMLLAPPETISDYIVEQSSDYWVCKCGNTPDSEGFSPCQENGTRQEDTRTMDSNHCLCERCFRIIDPHTLQIMGTPSEEVIEGNESYRWHDEGIFDQ